MELLAGISVIIRENSRLYHPTKVVKRAAIALMYQIGKSMLEAYGLFEE